MACLLICHNKAPLNYLNKIYNDAKTNHRTWKRFYATEKYTHNDAGVQNPEICQGANANPVLLEPLQNWYRYKKPKLDSLT